MNNVDYAQRQVVQKVNESGNMVIYGPPGTGKTTLASELQKKLNCNVIHMDDFFLPFEKRTPERLSEIGGNIDYERFSEEIVRNIRQDLVLKREIQSL